MVVSLLGGNEIRSLAAEIALAPTKKLGQNFVTDANTVRKIANLAELDDSSEVLEIGPGLGSLTLAITATGARVVAVEIDRRLAERLPRTLGDHGVPAEKAEVIRADALHVTSLSATPTVLVANLPYNVSVPVLLHLMHTVTSLNRGVVMVQAEVGHRLAASPGSKVYGVPSAKASWYGTWTLAGTVSRQVFWPIPNVDSVLVSFTVRAQPLGTEAERQRTFALIDAAFAQRRKMLRQALSGVFGGSALAVSVALDRVGIDPESRGEKLSIDDYLRIARATDSLRV